MERHLIGQTCALLAALTWAFALVLFKRSGERISPVALNLFKNTVGLVLLAVTLLLMGDGFGLLGTYPREDIYILLISGFLGIALADTVFFHALNLLGVGLISIMDCLYSPLVVLCSFLMLQEKLTVYHYVGGALVLGGLLVSSQHPPPAGRTRGQIVLGMSCAVAGLVMMAVGIVMAKPVLEIMDFPLFWATTLRLLAGTAALALLALGSPRRRELWSVFRPSAVWWYCVPGSVLGAYLAMVTWVAGFKYTYASVAAILNQTNALFAVVLATLILKEAFTRRKFVALVLAFCGVVLVTLSPVLSR
ncbi:MAG: DMT family transporter [Phycisphaerales bacterium]|nr:MAG: DMT family transporter [Phycisphaerales bacterium]